MRAASRLGLLLALAACERPRPLVICHNANCTGQPSSQKDDTIDGLRAALALDDGVLDGIEIDFVWDGARCLFAHVPDAPGHSEAAVAVDDLVAWRATHPAPFLVVIELKPTATPMALAACGFDALERLEAAGLTVHFDSADPDLHRALLADPRAAGRDLYLVADFSAPRPIVVGAATLDEFAGIPIDAITMHPRWATAAQAALPGELGVDLLFWSVLLGSETLDAIERWEPAAVTTGDAPFLRAWLEW